MANRVIWTHYPTDCPVGHICKIIIAGDIEYKIEWYEGYLFHRSMRLPVIYGRRFDIFYNKGGTLQDLPYGTLYWNKQPLCKTPVMMDGSVMAHVEWDDQFLSMSADHLLNLFGREPAVLNY